MNRLQTAANSKRRSVTPAFIIKAGRALRRAARNARAEHKRFGLRPLVWKDG